MTRGISQIAKGGVQTTFCQKHFFKDTFLKTFLGVGGMETP